MTWVTFPTLTDGQVLTGAHMQIVRDNFAETGPAKATSAGRFLVTTGANGIAERVPFNNFVGTTETTASTSYGDLATAGPAVTVTTSSQAIFSITSDAWNSTLSAYSYVSLTVSGASAIASSDSRSLSVRAPTADANAGNRSSFVDMVTGLTPGSNVFTAKYRVSAGTGRYANRSLLIIAL